MRFAVAIAPAVGLRLAACGRRQIQRPNDLFLTGMLRDGATLLREDDVSASSIHERELGRSVANVHIEKHWIRQVFESSSKSFGVRKAIGRTWFGRCASTD